MIFVKTDTTKGINLMQMMSIGDIISMNCFFFFEGNVHSIIFPSRLKILPPIHWEN